MRGQGLKCEQRVMFHNLDRRELLCPSRASPCSALTRISNAPEKYHFWILVERSRHNVGSVRLLEQPDRLLHGNRLFLGFRCRELELAIRLREAMQQHRSGERVVNQQPIFIAFVELERSEQARFAELQPAEDREGTSLVNVDQGCLAGESGEH